MRNLTAVVALQYLGYAVAYDSGDKGWKKDADGKIAVDADGNPIYIDSSGKELGLGADTVARLNREAQTNRERGDAAEKALKAFEGLDARAAREALDTVGKLKEGDLIKAGEADKVREEIKKSYETQLAERDGKLSATEQALSKLRMENAFGGSEYIKNNIAVPVDMMRAQFGSHFKFENDMLVPYDSRGEKIYSKKRGGEIASVDEALEILVDGYSYKDSILKGGGSGTGGAGAGGNRGGGRTMKRSDWENSSPAVKADVARKQAAGEITLVD